MPEQWTPEEGAWVIYRPHPDAQAEDGTIIEVIDSGLVRVRYWNDPPHAPAKATRVADLTPGPGEVTC